MADVFSQAKRSWVMSRIRGKDTGPERHVRSFLHRHGFRFSLHQSGLPGKPDIVLPKYRTVVFVHGCFWHGHSGCKRASMPATHRRFWSEKIKRNKARDGEVKRALQRAGWRILTVWECQITSASGLARRLRSLLAARARVRGLRFNE
jgi:DNA mismatch endonuclease (patch repair protein)